MTETPNPSTPTPMSPRHMLDQLRDETLHSRALLAIAPEDDRPDRRRAVAATLQLVHDLLTDARDLYDLDSLPGPRDPLVRERLRAQDRIDSFGLAEDGLPTGLPVGFEQVAWGETPC